MNRALVHILVIQQMSDRFSFTTDMDMTETFMQEATMFFTNENLPRFVRKNKLLNPVDPAEGY